MRRLTIALLLAQVASGMVSFPNFVSAQATPPCIGDPVVARHKCIGSYTWPNGNLYVGDWLDGMMSQGTLTYADGQQYIGNFRNNVRWGSGTLYTANGTIQVIGIWVDDVLAAHQTSNVDLLAGAEAAVDAGNFGIAVSLWQGLAREGDPAGQFSLGAAFNDGVALPRDPIKAANWYRLAAEQGHVMAQFRLALLYVGGDGVPQNFVLAAQFFRLAAENGHPEAQAHLGYLFVDGTGVPRNYIQAYAWLSVAAAQGMSSEPRDVLAAGMTAEQIAEGQRLSSSLWELYVVPFQN